MAITLAFDVYGTLIDTHGVTALLAKHLGPRAQEFSRTWRDKQLEYSFRRGLMKKYETFARCTSDALLYTSAFFKVTLSPKDRDELLAAYRTLPAFEDVRDGLSAAADASFRLFAFSNGTPEAVETLLRNAGIRDRFLGVVSVDEVRSFKPDPSVYQHFLRKADTTGPDAWLISGNPFDVIGALSAGMRAAWVKRSPDAVYDPWGMEPTVTVDGLRSLAAQINEVSGRQ